MGGLDAHGTQSLPDFRDIEVAQSMNEVLENLAKAEELCAENT